MTSITIPKEAIKRLGTLVKEYRDAFDQMFDAYQSFGDDYMKLSDGIQKVYKALKADHDSDETYLERDDPASYLQGLEKAMSLMREELGLDEDGEWT